MKAKDLFLDFLNIAFLAVLVSSVIFFFIGGNRFSVFVEILKSLFPIAVFLLIFLIVMNIKRLAFKEKRARGEEDEEITLILNNSDLFKWDAVIFSLPMIVLIIALIIDKGVTLTDIIQAAIALLIMYYWKKRLLNRGNIY